MGWLSNDEYSRKRRFMRIRTRVSDNARVYLYTSSFPFRSLHSAHSARRIIRIRIVSSSALQDASTPGEYATPLVRPSAQLVHRPVISRGETNAGSQVFLIAHPRRILRRSSYRFQSSIGEESSALFYARLTLVSSPLQTDPS